MTKLIAAINMTLDGYCDHTAVIADEELHQHYADLLRNAGAILYGRITYQLMEYWRTVVKEPTGNKEMDEFAVIMDMAPKVVFSRTLRDVDWESARLAGQDIREEVRALKEAGMDRDKDIYIGSPSLIVACMNLGLVDELQLCVHPVVAGSGLPLFKDMNDRTMLKLVRTKTLGGGAVILYYEPVRND